ncbi:LysR family transcriptional regulator [[Eubacterium] hominis]|uniref:LysR family transcriptional regulator n=1 Tax=[Eubacterium] hominis TaxID=2764325 RepID=UPI003A4D9DA7
MKINQLKNFVAIVDYGSINKASERLYVSQPALSRSIQALEEEMGKELLVRSNHGVSMTPTGRLLYYYSQSILNELSTLEKLKRLGEKAIYSKLSVSINNIFLKDDLILQCYEKLLSNETEIQMMETTAEDVFNDVINSKSELGIMIMNDYQLPVLKKMAEINNLELFIIGTGPIYIHVNENNPLASKDAIRFSELLDCTYIHLPSDFFSNLNHSINIDGIQLTSFPKTLVMSNYHAILSILKKTNSFLVGHRWQVDELKHSKVKSLLLLNSDINKHFVILKRKNELFSDAAEIFLKIINENYAQM